MVAKGTVDFPQSNRVSGLFSNTIGRQIAMKGGFPAGLYGRRIGIHYGILTIFRVLMHMMAGHHNTNLF